MVEVVKLVSACSERRAARRPDEFRAEREKRERAALLG